MHFRKESQKPTPEHPLSYWGTTMRVTFQQCAVNQLLIFILRESHLFGFRLALATQQIILMDLERK